MAVKNGNKFISAAIDSVINQSYKDFEFIIVDDGSSDSTPTIINRYSKQFPFIRILTNIVNIGQGGSFNRAISLSSGEVVCFIDSDDMWLPNKLNVVVSIFQKYDTASFFQHNLFLCREDGVPFGIRERELRSGYLSSEGGWSHHIPNFVPTSGLSFRKSVLNLVGPIPEKRFRISADGFLTRTSIYFGSVVADTNCLGYYRIHGSNAVANAGALEVNHYVEERLKPSLNYFYAKRAIDFFYQGAYSPRFSDGVGILSGLLTTGMPPLNEIVVTCVAPIDACKQVIDSCRALYPCAKIYGLCSARMQDAISPLVDRIYVFETSDRSNSLENMPADLHSFLHTCEPGLIIYPMNGEPDRHKNVIGVLEPYSTRHAVVGVDFLGRLLVSEPFRRFFKGDIIVGGEFLSRAHRENRRVLARFKDSHLNQTCLVVANGPSLNSSDLERMSHLVSFGSNKVYLLFDTSAWRPTYYCISDSLVARQNSGAISECFAQTQTFCAVGVRRFLPNLKVVSYIQGRAESSNEFGKIPNPLANMSCGHSVVVLQLRLAFFMGFKNVLVTGLDHHFEPYAQNIKNGHLEMGSEVIVSSGEVNHFDPRYRKDGELWSVPQLDKITEEFKQLNALFARSGRRIINISRKSAFTGFQRASIDELENINLTN